MTAISRQTSLGHITFQQREIQEQAFALARKHLNIGPTQPIRALTVSVTKLCPADEIVEQMNLFDLGKGKAKSKKQEKPEALVDVLHDKHGEGSIALGYQKNKVIGVERGEGRL